MFSKDITNSDDFIDMPLSSQALYFHLGMNADDDGFASPKSICRLVQAKDDDLKILIYKKFVIEFESGVIVITHRKVNNNLRGDRYSPTIYKREYEQLVYNGLEYTVPTIGMHSIVKSSIVKSSIDKKNSTPPSVDLNILYSAYPHARKTKKAETLKYLAKLDYDIVLYALKILKREVRTWQQDQKYIPAMERWARDFVQLDATVTNKKLLEIYRAIRAWENTKDNIAKFVDDFGRDKVLELYAIIDAENKKLLLSGLK